MLSKSPRRAASFFAAEDFSTDIKILEFQSGDKYIDVNISIINDESIEGNETFTIYLTSDVGVNVSPYVQTEVTIIDDDEDDDDEDDDDDGKLLELCSSQMSCVGL